MPENKLGISTFSNKYKYRQMLVEKDITVYSFCEHHFYPLLAKRTLFYISNGDVIGLSKINRIVDYYAKRPQVQERLTMQIVDALKKQAFGNERCSFLLLMRKHLCVNCRGIKDICKVLPLPQN